MKVLIIHRQQSFLRGVKEKFLSGGWHVHTTDNGLDGLMTARHQQFDLILCGFDLSVISGTELIRSLRMMSFNQATPVFFLKDGNEKAWQIDMADKLEAHLITEEEVNNENTGRLAWLS